MAEGKNGDELTTLPRGSLSLFWDSPNCFNHLASALRDLPCNVES